MRFASQASAVAVFALAVAPGLSAQTLPPTPPTAASATGVGGTAPLAATAATSRSGAARHRAEVSCANGQLVIRANNSSLNGILRSISQCTGMSIAGGVADQRVFGTYGPAAPATVLATLLDGTGVNMLLQETAADQPSHLILTPRTGGPTPPSPREAPDTDLEVAANSAQGGGASGPVQQPGGQGAVLGPAQGAPNAQPAVSGLQPYQGIGNRPGSAVTSPQPIPQPINNVNGSPSNTSPTASTYPTTNSTAIDTLPTPSTTPSSNGIVDAPNPPAPGSDTAALLNSRTNQVPGTTNIQGGNTANQTLPGGTNTTLPAPPQSTLPGAAPSGQGSGTLTPQQVFDQLRQMQQQMQSQGQSQGQTGSGASPSQGTQTTNGTPQQTGSGTPQ